MSNKGTKDVSLIACEDTEQYLSKKIQVKLATGQLVNPNVILRVPERVGGPRANIYKKWGHTNGLCEGSVGVHPQEILHALKCVLGAPEALFHAFRSDQLPCHPQKLDWNVTDEPVSSENGDPWDPESTFLYEIRDPSPQFYMILGTLP